MKSFYRCECWHGKDDHIPGEDGFIYECLKCVCTEFKPATRPYQQGVGGDDDAGGTVTG